MKTPHGHTTPTPASAFWFHAAGAVLRRPSLWWTAVRQFRRMTPRQWWRRRPFLPLPDRAYVQFRFETAYGSQGMPTVPDLLTYLEWCREGERRRQRSDRRGGERGVDPEVTNTRLASDHT